MASTSKPGEFVASASFIAQTCQNLSKVSAKQHLTLFWCCPDCFRLPALVRGMLTLDELKALVSRGDIETVVIGFTDHYGRMCGKRTDAEFFLEAPGTAACNYLLAVDMVRTSITKAAHKPYPLNPGKPAIKQWQIGVLLDLQHKKKKKKKKKAH